MLNHGQVPVEGHKRQKQNLDIHVYIQNRVVEFAQNLKLIAGIASKLTFPKTHSS